MTSIKKITIYGERCSGTNYLEQLLINNFDIEIFTYGSKHFFGFTDLSNTDDVLFIGIIRNITDWVNSLYREKHHLPINLTRNVNTFLNNNFYSIDEKNKEIMSDRNIYTQNRYTNIFELRHTKNKFLVEDMPKLVKNNLVITYDNLLNNFEKTMNLIKDCNLSVKNNIDFPKNILYYTNNKNIKYIKKNNIIPRNIIIRKADLYYEKILFNENY